MEDQTLEKIGKLYMKYGVKSLSVDELANHLGWSKKTLYKKFGSKKSSILLSGKYILTKFYVEKLQEIMDSAENPIIAFIECRNFMLNTQSIYQDRLNVYELKKYYHSIYDEIMSLSEKFFTELYTKLIIDGKSSGLIKEIISTKSAVELYVRSLIDLRTIDKNIKPFTYDKMDDELYYIFLSGISTEAGKKIIDQYLTKINQR